MSDDPKLLVFDIETTSLEANRGHILCAAAKWVGKPQKFVWRIDDNPKYGDTPTSMSDDSAIVRSLVELAREADAVIAYYGGYGKFDVPYVNTRALANGLEPLPELTVIDPFETSKRVLKLSRNSMGTVAFALGLQKQKTQVPWEIWQRAQYGDKKALDIIVEYNINDIEVLEDVYLAMRPLIRNHPYVARPRNGALDPATQCPACGSYDSKFDGSRRTKSFIACRRRCKKCGTGFTAQRLFIKAGIEPVCNRR